MNETKLTKEALYVPSIVFDTGTLSSSSDGKVIWNGEELGGNANALYKEMNDTLLHNAIYHLNEMESINFNLDENLNDLFSCEVDFTSGATPTVVTSDSRIKWVGDDVNDGVFTPVANVRYSCSLQYDGVFVRGMTFGIPTV